VFDLNKLAPTYPESMVLKPPIFSVYYDVADMKPVDGEIWRLELAGLIADKEALDRRRDRCAFLRRT
jgi:hypothetical protein